MNTRHKFLINKWYNYYKDKFKDNKKEPSLTKDSILQLKLNKDIWSHYTKVNKFIYDYLDNKHDKSIKPASNGPTEGLLSNKIIDAELISSNVAYLSLTEFMGVRNYTIPLVLRVLQNLDEDTICKIIAYLKYSWDYGIEGKDWEFYEWGI